MELADGKAEIHAQIGVDAGPCVKSCQFCSFAKCNNPEGELKLTPMRAILDYARAFQDAGANLILLMSSAAFPFEQLGEIGERVREVIGPEMPMLINTRGLSLEEALFLRRAGYNGAYHAARMSEGELTDIPLAVRIETMENLSRAGLPLSFCIEPVGEEHTAEDFVEKLKLHLRFQPLTGGVGRRIPVRGTKVENCRKFDQAEQARLIALYRLLDPRTPLVGSANATLAANSGANLCWAECGYNPRDFSGHTELDGVGRSVATIAGFYAETGWELRKEYSPGWNMQAIGTVEAK
jgi:biotin synthase